MTARIVAASLVALGLMAGAGPHSIAHGQTVSSWQRPMPAEARRFLLPKALTGALTGNPRMGTGCAAPCAPYADYTPRSTGGLVAGTAAVYSYQVAPPVPTRGWRGGMYVVAIYRTADEARQANLAVRDANSYSWLLDGPAHRLPIARPVNPTTEWLRAYLSRVSPQYSGHLRDCYAIGGIRDGNVLMLAQIDNWDHIPTSGAGICQTSRAWTMRMLAALYARAVVQGPMSGPAPQPTLTAVPSADPALEFGQTASAEQFVAAQLYNFGQMSQLHDQGVLSSASFANTAAHLVRAPDQITVNLQQTAMTGRYATARLLLVDALSNITDLWQSVVASGGQTYDLSAFSVALAELRTAERYVPAS